MLRRAALPLLLLLLLLASLLAVPTAASAAEDDVPPVEDYAGYEAPRRCKPAAKPGTVVLQRWTVATFGGAAGGTARSCGKKATSEHHEGRAFDWTVSVRSKSDRLRVRKFLRTVLATGPTGETHELARRMGVMYVIWDDRMWASYRGFEPTPYVSSSCRGKSLRKCSATLRHRDHVHVSLSRAGARARTSWYGMPEARRLR